MIIKPINKNPPCFIKCDNTVPVPTVYTKLELAEYTGKKEKIAKIKMKDHNDLSPLKYFCIIDAIYIFGSLGIIVFLLLL